METTLRPLEITPDAELLKIIATFSAAGKAYSRWLAAQDGSSCYNENANAFRDLVGIMDEASSRLIDLLVLKLQYSLSEQRD